jgi:hypothetical protein
LIRLIRPIGPIAAEPATSAVLGRVMTVAGPIEVWTVGAAGDGIAHARQSATPLKGSWTTPVFHGPMARQEPTSPWFAPVARPTDLLFAAGFCSFGAGTSAARCPGVGGLYQKRKAVKINPKRT